MLRKTLKSLISLFLISTIIGCTGEKTEVSKEYPSKNIEVVVVRNAGGGTDTTARVIASELEKQLGTSMTIFNRAGGDGVIGTNHFSKAKPDGYTVSITSNNEMPNMLVNGQGVNFKPEDFKNIASFNTKGYILTMKRGSQFENLEEFVSYAKSNPGKVTLGIPGGSVMTTAENLLSELGIEATIINAGGGNDLVTQLLGGHIEAAICGSHFYDMVTDEKLSTFGLTLEEPLHDKPELPTFKSMGYDVLSEVFVYLTVPTNTPDDVVEILSIAVDKAFNEGDLSASLTKINEYAKYRKADELNDYLDSYYEETIEKLKEIKNREL